MPTLKEAPEMHSAILDENEPMKAVQELDFFYRSMLAWAITRDRFMLMHLAHELRRCMVFILERQKYIMEDEKTDRAEELLRKFDAGQL